MYILKFNFKHIKSWYNALINIFKKEIRGNDELFDSGEIFDATTKELHNVLKIVSTENVPNETVRHREIIRALTVLTVINERKATSNFRFNIFYTTILIALAIMTYQLSAKQAKYVEFSTRDDRINQQIDINQAVELCKINLNMKTSRLFNVISGEPASCESVLLRYDN